MRGDAKGSIKITVDSVPGTLCHRVEVEALITDPHGPSKHCGALLVKREPILPSLV